MLGFILGYFGGLALAVAGILGLIMAMFNSGGSEGWIYLVSIASITAGAMLMERVSRQR